MTRQAGATPRRYTLEFIIAASYAHHTARPLIACFTLLERQLAQGRRHGAEIFMRHTLHRDDF